MKVSVVIIAKNAQDLIRYTLNSLRRQYRKPDEVIIVVPSSNDNTLKVLKEYPEVQVIITGKSIRGFARAIGVRNAIGDIIAFIDSDCVAHPSWLRALEDLYSREESIMVQGGPTIGVRDLRQVPQRNLSKLKYLLPRDVKFLPTANFSFRRKILRIVGNFDEKLHEGEDLDFCVRLLKRKVNITMNPRATVYHHSKDDKVSIRRSVKYGASRAVVFLMYKRHIISATLTSIIHFSLILASLLMLIIRRYDLFLAAIGTSLLHQFYKFWRGYVQREPMAVAIKTFIVSTVSSYVLYISCVVHLLYYALLNTKRFLKVFK